MSTTEFMHEIKALIAAELQNVHTAMPGKVVAFDPDGCAADILPYGKYRKLGGGLIDFPKLMGVPVWFPQGAGQSASIAFPVKPGDACLLLFAEQSLDAWRAGGESGTDLRFDLANAVAIVGLFAHPGKLASEATADDALILEKDGAQIRIRKDGVRINANMDAYTKGAAVFHNGLHVIGSALIEGDAHVTQDLVVDGSATVAGNLEVSGSSIIDGNIDIGGSLSTGGSATVGTNADITGNASVGGGFTVSGNVEADADVTISGTLTLAGVNFNEHTHSGVTEGEDKSGPPESGEG